MTLQTTLAEIRGILRSLWIYQCDLAKRRRGIDFYGQFAGPGDLCFDIGAHVGGRVGWFRALGAGVVAVEPLPAMVRILRLLYGRDRSVAILPVAVGRAAGRAVLHASSGNPTLATLDADWVGEAATTDGFRHIRWDDRLEVETVTLDQLIERHGLPRFCKIDVEAAEEDVLAGLSQPIPALCFEFLQGQEARAERCLDLLAALGSYEFALSHGESFEFAPPGWCGLADAKAALHAVPKGTGHGDIYARLRDG